MNLDLVDRTQPRELEDDAAATVSVVQQYLSDFEPEFNLDLLHHWWSFSLPSVSTAEYQFTLHGELGGERQISARPVESSRKFKRRTFWYSALEMAGFRNNASALENSFHERVTALITHPTRIIEKKGVVWLSYSAEYEDETGWHRLKGGVKYLGLGIGIPFIGKKRIYSSPPLSRAAQV